MSIRFNMKKNVMAVVLSLMMVSSAVVFAAETYSFTMETYSRTAYSAPYTKSIEATYAYVQQTGSSPGTYTVTYTVCANDSAKTALSNAKTYQNTDYYTTKEIMYKPSKKAFSGSTVLKGYYNGNSLHSVAGKWNPNGLNSN